jgi:hypothetical protein
MGKPRMDLFLNHEWTRIDTNKVKDWFSTPLPYSCLFVSIRGLNESFRESLEYSWLPGEIELLGWFQGRFLEPHAKPEQTDMRFFSTQALAQQRDKTFQF